jgi:hypothetical protein
VTAVLALGVFVTFVVFVTLTPSPLHAQLQTGDTIETMFSTMITAIVTGTTLVVTIGQLVLSQENGPLGDQRERMASSMDFRDFTEELIGSPSPADPSEFLRQIIKITAQRTTALRESIDKNDDENLREEVDEFAENVTGNADMVRDQLEGAEFGSFDVVFAALNFNYSWKIFQVERLANEYEESLDEEQRGLLDDLKTALVHFGPAREHIKTLYFQWALIDMSRMILYAAVPAVAVAGIMVAIVGVGTFPGSTLGFDHIILVVGGAFAVTLIPFMLFVSYVLRILTIAKRTLAIEPLLLRGSQR